MFVNWVPVYVPSVFAIYFNTIQSFGSFHQLIYWAMFSTNRIYVWVCVWGTDKESKSEICLFEDDLFVYVCVHLVAYGVTAVLIWYPRACIACLLRRGVSICKHKTVRRYIFKCIIDDSNTLNRSSWWGGFPHKKKRSLSSWHLHYKDVNHCCVMRVLSCVSRKRDFSVSQQQ